MTDNSWYPFYVGDYDRKTAHLSLLEHGAYRRLLDHYYATKSPIPDDPAKLFRICGARTPNERKAVLSTAAEFFIKDGTLRRHKRCDREIDKQLKYRERQSAAALKRQCQLRASLVLHAPVPQPQSKKVSTNITTSQQGAEHGKQSKFLTERNRLASKFKAQAEREGQNDPAKPVHRDPADAKAIRDNREGNGGDN